MKELTRYSKRLNSLASFVNCDQNLADIGSDHGFLVSILIENGFSKEILAVENKKGPFENLVKNLSAYQKDFIHFSLSNGLEEVESKYETVVIAGMGFATIKSIINKDLSKLDFIKTFIIDCHTNQTEVRKYFVDLGYMIEEEKTIFEDNVFYDLIKFKKTNYKEYYNDLELEYGPINIKNLDPVFKNRILKEIEYKEKVISLTVDEKKKTTLKTEIQKLRKLIGD